MKTLIRVVVIVVLFAFLLWYCQEWLIFFPARLSSPPPLRDFEGKTARHVFFSTADKVSLHGVWVTAAGSSTSRLAVVYSHCNAGNLAHRLGRLAALVRALPIDVLLYDYRGYGLSSGTPSVNGVIADAQAAYQFVRDQGYPPERILLYGVSLGTGVAGALAERLGDAPAGIVLESGFRSLSSRAGARFPIIGPAILRGDLPTSDFLSRYHGPLLIIHSKADRVIPYADGEALYAASPSTRKEMLTLEHQGHNDAVWQDPAYLAAWERFLARTAQPATPDTPEPPRE